MDATSGEHRQARRIVAWVTIARGGLALALGSSLLVQGKSESLVTFMGLYWLVGGVLVLAFHREIRAVGARRLPILAGAFGVIATRWAFAAGGILPAQGLRMRRYLRLAPPAA